MTAEPKEDALDDLTKQSPDTNLPEQVTGNDDTEEADEEDE
jgi:hypothetical protein